MGSCMSQLEFIAMIIPFIILLSIHIVASEMFSSSLILYMSFLTYEMALQYQNYEFRFLPVACRRSLIMPLLSEN